MLYNDIKVGGFMKYFEKINGDRIYLSPISVEDKEIYTKWVNDKSVAENIGNYYKVISLSVEEEKIKQMEKKYSFSIVLKEKNELIGYVSLMDINFINQTATLGIFIGDEKNRNKGYGKEAIKLILNYGFNYLNINNIMLHVYSFNKKAINLYEKIGFKKIGVRRDSIYSNGLFYDEIFMDILKSEFNDVKDFIFTD